MKLIEIDEKLLLKLYNEDLLSIVKCAEVLKVSESCIRRRLRKLKIIIRSPGEQNTHQDITKEQVVDLYLNQGLSVAQCAEKLNKSETFVKNRLKTSGIKTRSVIEGLRKFHKTDNITDEEIIDLYENKKMSTYEISKYFNKSPYFARQRLWAIDYTLRENAGEFNGSWKGGISRQIDVSKHQEICDLYSNDKDQTCKQIAAKYNVSPIMIIEILKNNNIVPSRLGSRNSSWKGGITPLHLKIRGCDKSDEWKRLCRERDGYKCRISGATNNLQVHHYPLTFSEIFANFLNENMDLNPVDDCDKLFELSQNYEPFWDIENGMTIAEEIHQKLHNNKEKMDAKIMTLYNNNALKNKNRIIQLYNSGVKTWELSKMYQVSDTTIRNILKANNIE